MDMDAMAKRIECTDSQSTPRLQRICANKEIIRHGMWNGSGLGRYGRRARPLAMSGAHVRGREVGGIVPCSRTCSTWVRRTVSQVSAWAGRLAMSDSAGWLPQGDLAGCRRAIHSRRRGGKPRRHAPMTGHAWARATGDCSVSTLNRIALAARACGAVGRGTVPGRQGHASVMHR